MSNLRKETIELIRQIYHKYPSGGALHIVIDDGNTEDNHIYWCIENSIRELTEDKSLFEQCATNLLKLGTWRKRDNVIYEAYQLYKSDLIHDKAIEEIAEEMKEEQG